MLLICKTHWVIMIWAMNKVKIYRVVPKKHPILLFVPKSCFTIFFYIFQVVHSAGLGHSFDTDMNPTGWFTTQQWIKIIEACLSTKSVLLTQRKFRRDFGRNSVPDRRTIQRLVTKFWKTGNVADAPQRPQWSIFKWFKSNKPGSFSILGWISSQNISPSTFFWSVCLCKIWILWGKSLMLSWRIFKTNVLEISFLWETACWFSGEFLKAFL